MKLNHIIAALLILICLLAFLKYKNSRENSTLNTTLSQGGRVVILPDSANAIVPATAKDTPEKIIAWTNSERKALLKRTPLENKDGMALINTTVHFLKRCETGDLDAIRLDFKGNKSKKLKIGFENLESGKEISSYEFPENFLDKEKFEYQFSIPTSENPSLHGFFICSTTGSEKCSQKEGIDINKIFVEHYNNKDYIPKDRLYFFQFALVDSRGLAAFSKHPKGEEPFKETEAYLVERGIHSTTAKNILEKSKEWTHTLISLPVNFTTNSITLEIPQKSEAECAK